jgi:hypothetical protein
MPSMNLDRRYNLNMSLYPSFTYPFYSRIDGWYVKIIGEYKGLRFKLEEPKVLRFEGAPIGSEHVVLEFTGLWFNPYSYVSRLSSSRISRVWPLIEAYDGVGLAIDPYSRLWLFTSITLSRHTDFHLNTVRWVRKLAETIGDLRMLTMDNSRMVSRSFHLSQLPMQIRFYLKRIEPLEDRIDPSMLRVKLQEGPWIGPKTATSYLLFSRRDATYMASSDIHFQKISRRIGLIDWGIPWSASMCRRYLCIDCPLRSECLHWIARVEYGELAGWIQTIAYIHDKLLCNRRLCNECKVRCICTEYRSS